MAGEVLTQVQVVEAARRVFGGLLDPDDDAGHRLPRHMPAGDTERKW